MRSRYLNCTLPVTVYKIFLSSIMPIYMKTDSDEYFFQNVTLESANKQHDSSTFRKS